ncbi:MAG: FtsH protease activity modulator HflK [Spirochaetales bacterium]|nr:FtsH protease activity modulator HflK [Spirochaetales bacterium]
MPFDFFQSGQNGGPQGPQGQSDRQTRRRGGYGISPKLIIGLIIAIVLIVIILSSFYVVDQTEQAVVLRWGKYVKTEGPGLHFKLPLGIDTNYNVPTQVIQTMTFGYRNPDSNFKLSSNYSNETVMLTGDLNIIEIEWIVQYKIVDPYAWLFNVGDTRTTIYDVSRSIMNQLVGDLPILSVMTEERTSIEVEAEEMMQAIFDRYKLGVRVVTVKLQNIVPPKGSVQDAFEDVNKAIQDMNRYINEGKESYNSAIPAAQGEASKAILVAQGYAAERVNQAIGDVARFSAVQKEYENAKEVTRMRLYIEAFEEIFAGNGTPVTLIDKDLENFLPISNIQTGGAR